MEERTKMSTYNEARTDFKDAGILIAALAAMGYTVVENCIGNPQPLIGFQGDMRTLDGVGHTKVAAEAMRADIIIRRKYVGGASNDLGFVRGTDGKFSAIISDYDSSKHNPAWLAKLRGEYAEANVVRTMKKMGARITSRTTRRNAQGQDEVVYSYSKA
jgi:hypothetical protein